MEKEFSKAISLRYDELSGQQCCLSCGGAINFAGIKPGFVCADLYYVAGVADRWQKINQEPYFYPIAGLWKSCTLLEQNSTFPINKTHKIEYF